MTWTTTWSLTIYPTSRHGNYHKGDPRIYGGHSFQVHSTCHLDTSFGYRIHSSTCSTTHPTSRGATSVLTYLTLYLAHTFTSTALETRACVGPDGLGDSTIGISGTLTEMETNPWSAPLKSQRGQRTHRPCETRRLFPRNSTYTVLYLL